eukprot:342217-Ditylum_brightwellii.AAC.1
MRKNDNEKLKEQVTKQKKEIEDGIAYRKDNKADLGGNMYSPKGHLDVTDLLLKLLVTGGTMLLVDATAILEMNQKSDVIQNE